ncbi:MAG: RDD family protein [Deltaproteobacteria bacterium]
MESDDAIAARGERDLAAPLPAAVAPPLPPVKQIRLAKAATRVAAFAVDLLLLALADIVIGVLAAFAIGLASVTTQTFFVDGHQAVEQFTFVGSACFVFFYFTGMHIGAGQTLGKAFFDIAVERSDGSALDWRQSLLRSSAELLTLATLGLGFLGATRPSGRALHDHLADTRVVRSHGGPGL